MNNTLLQVKIKQRLNKLDSNDYDNLECWMIVEAFNKAQTEWVRRRIAGNNQKHEGGEQSITSVDDLQVILKSTDLTGVNQSLYFESTALPSDYLDYKRVNAEAVTADCLDPRRMIVRLGEEANSDELLKNKNTSPSFEWAETFSTVVGNQIRIYTDKNFEVVAAKLLYYRQPKKIQIAQCIDPESGDEAVRDEICEFKDDIIELMIDETASILAGDIESFNQVSRNKSNAESNI